MGKFSHDVFLCQGSSVYRTNWGIELLRCSYVFSQFLYVNSAIKNAVIYLINHAEDPLT